jgi:hypothetical protein
MLNATNVLMQDITEKLGASTKISSSYGMQRIITTLIQCNSLHTLRYYFSKINFNLVRRGLPNDQF